MIEGRSDTFLIWIFLGASQSVTYNISNAGKVHIGAVVTLNMAGAPGQNSSAMSAPKKTREIKGWFISIFSSIHYILLA